MELTTLADAMEPVCPPCNTFTCQNLNSDNCQLLLSGDDALALSCMLDCLVLIFI